MTQQSTAELFWNLWNLWNPLHSTPLQCMLLSTITLTLTVQVVCALPCTWQLSAGARSGIAPPTRRSDADDVPLVCADVDVPPPHTVSDCVFNVRSAGTRPACFTGVPSMQI